MEFKYTIMLILLGYLLFIACCWKFFIIPRMMYIRENQNGHKNKNRVGPETHMNHVVPDIP